MAHKKTLSFSAKSFIGMGLGIAVGLLAGDYAAMLQPLGEIFLQILQMTVIPFLVVSLILGIASLDPGLLRKVGTAMALSFIAVWGLALGAVFTLGQAFPGDGRPTFHVHPEAVTTAPESSMIDLFISSNPFSSLADGAVPAVVLFFILLSAHLVKHPKKQAVLDFLQPIQDALLWLTSWLTKVTPYGVFILTAELAGTLSLSDLQKLSLYLTLYVVGSLTLAFWLLPMAISLSTPYRFRTMIRECTGLVVLAISSGSTLVALPMLIQSLRGLVAQDGGQQRTSDVEAVVPVAFNFPHAGTMLGFLFVLFAAAAYGVEISTIEHLALVASGIPMFFAGSISTMNFLIDQTGVPNDALGLYFNADSILYRFRAGVSVVTLIVVSLWIHAALTNQLRFRPARLGVLIGGTLGTLLAAALLIRPFVSHEGSGIDLYQAQTLPSQTVQVLDRMPSVPLPGTGRERLMRAEPLVLGYLPDALPYSYRNARGDLVGYYVAMADRLGHDLGVLVQLAPVTRDQQASALASGQVDSLLAPVAVTQASLQQFDFSRIYAEERAFVLLRAGHSEDIERRLKAGEASGLRLAVLPDSLSMEQLAPLVPGAELTLVDSIDTFRQEAFDGLLLNEVLAKAEQIRNPLYHAVAISEAPIIQFAFPVIPGNDLRVVLDTWLQMIQNDGFLIGIDQQWIDGKFESQAPARRPLLLDLLPTRPGAAAAQQDAR